LYCPAPLRRGGWPICSEMVAYFTPKGRPVCSESLAFLLRNTHPENESSLMIDWGIRKGALDGQEILHTGTDYQQATGG
jgi:hypothetical protein